MSAGDGGPPAPALGCPLSCSQENCTVTAPCPAWGGRQAGSSRQPPLAGTDGAASSRPAVPRAPRCPQSEGRVLWSQTELGGPDEGVQRKGSLKQSPLAAESTVPREAQPDGAPALAAEVTWGCTQTKGETRLGFPSARAARHPPELGRGSPRPVLGAGNGVSRLRRLRASVTRAPVSCSTQGTGSTACPRSILRGRVRCGRHLGTMLPVPLVTSWRWQEGSQA